MAYIFGTETNAFGLMNTIQRIVYGVIMYLATFRIACQPQN